MDTQRTGMDAELFALQDGVFVRRSGVTHREEEYDEQAFRVLQDMQHKHFWYRGRHRFLFAALQRQLARLGRAPGKMAVLDLGTGCGGWVRYLAAQQLPGFRELALADSSRRALAVAASVAGPAHACYQVDLRDLGWRQRWDVIFLLDVLEHIGDQRAVLEQIRDSLAPGGLLLVTAPALNFFWSCNDELALHQRRYAKKDFAELAGALPLQLLDARYFMFFLSPLLLAARAGRRGAVELSAEARAQHIAATHRVPPRPLNALLAATFAAETPLGLRWNFPWGTSLLGVFQKP